MYFETALVCEYPKILAVCESPKLALRPTTTSDFAYDFLKEQVRVVDLVGKGREIIFFERTGKRCGFGEWNLEGWEGFCEVN